VLRLSVGLLTFNHYRTNRADLFQATLESIRRESYPHTLDVVTNGSNDGTEQVVRDLGGIVDDGNQDIWYGMDVAIHAALNHEPDIVVLTADDVVHRPGWMVRLAAFWEVAPGDIKLAGLYIEPEWPWNVVQERADIGGQMALIRPSVPGSSWTFRAGDVDLILPLERIFPGEDAACCARLVSEGYRLAQLDMADHVGEHRSAWGNSAFTRDDTVPAGEVIAKWMPYEL
jgi:glycosyltransferase involved in cell wall biosynthesis